MPDTVILIPGAGGAAWLWHRVTPLLEAAGHEAIALDLPADDPAAGLDAYADLLVDSAAGRDAVVVVAQSLGAFTALHASARLPLQRLVLLNAMVPAPGETAGDWWENTGSEAARVATAREHGYSETLDLGTYFFHDVPPEIVAAAAEYAHDEAEIAFEQPCGFERWPDVPTAVLAGRGDRFFPLAFQRRVARERIGVDVTELPGGHVNMLSEPEAVTRAILGA